MLRKPAPRRGRASVVDGPVNDLAFPRALPNIVGGHDVAVIRGRNAGAIDPCTKSFDNDAVDPRINVSLLLGQHAAALLLVEKNYGGGRESLAPCGCGRASRIRFSQPRGIRHGFQLLIQPPIEQHEKSESRGFDCGPVAPPAIGGSPRGIVQPVSCVSKSLAKSFEISVAGIVVTIEAKKEAGVILAVSSSQGSS